ncbi:MAG: hypothetical protein U1C46_12000 [Bacteroidales bacterium]|nr:hypothetical protein [Bacteroidales bacterium]
MNKTKLFKITALIMAAFVMNTIAYAQQSTIKSRWSIKLSGMPGYNTSVGKKKMGFIKTEVNYGFTNFFEIGSYVGVQEGLFSKPIQGGVETQKKIFPIFGLGANVHLLPLIVKNPNLRFDFYLAGKVGGRHVSGDVNNSGLSWNYFAGIGLSAYLLKHIGVFTEYGYEPQINPSIKTIEKPKIFWGIAFKF